MPTGTIMQAGRIEVKSIQYIVQCRIFRSEINKQLLHVPVEQIIKI